MLDETVKPFTTPDRASLLGSSSNLPCGGNAVGDQVGLEKEPAMTNAHTPGPLVVERFHGGYFVTAPSNNSQSEHRITVAEFKDAQLGAFYSHQAKGNAELFAAAPEMLEALISILNIEGAAVLGGEAPVYKGLDISWHFEKARAAILKAEGKLTNGKQVTR